VLPSKPGRERVLEVELLEGFEGLDKIEGEWDDLWLSSRERWVFLHPIWARCWVSHYGEDVSPKLLCVRNERGELVGLAPLCTSRGDPQVFKWIGGEELSDTQDLVIRRGWEAMVLSSLNGILRKILGPRGRLDLHFVSEGSPILSEANDMLMEGWDVRIELEECAPFVDLPETWEEFLSSLKGHHRHELRRKMGKLERSFPVRFREVATDDGWEEGLENFFRLHRASQVEKAQFMDKRREAFFREMGWAFRKKGILRLTELSVENGPVLASAVSFVTGETWALYNSGFDPQYRQLSPGIVLVAKTIFAAIEEGLRRYDFLRGRELYKYDFGAKDRLLYKVSMAPRP
jgi:CelD/BcsL family acetyltransferase involved in cellulose biosynthesis